MAIFFYEKRALWLILSIQFFCLSTVITKPFFFIWRACFDLKYICSCMHNFFSDAQSLCLWAFPHLGFSQSHQRMGCSVMTNVKFSRSSQPTSGSGWLFIAMGNPTWIVLNALLWFDYCQDKDPLDSCYLFSLRWFFPWRGKGDAAKECKYFP